MISAADIHARVDWPSILVQLGIPEVALRSKHGPCPGCGGKDTFHFKLHNGRHVFYCNKLGAGGDGFALLGHVFGWPFAETRKRVMDAAGLQGGVAHRPNMLLTQLPRVVAAPSQRVNRLRRERCGIEDCDDAVDYLASRGLWALPQGVCLASHAAVDYWDGKQRVGRYPALVADVVDYAGDLVTVHVTYLDHGKKLAGYEPRKLLSGLAGRKGCAVRLMPAGAVLGVAEGIETALSAALLESSPVWAAINATLLVKFEPPAGVQTLAIYADRDEAGLTAALKLAERLQGRLKVETRIPPPPHKDWNDVLMARRKQEQP